MRLGLIIALVATIVDQFTKWWFMEVFLEPPTNFVHVIPCLNIVKTWNKGISFSMFASESEVGRWLLATLSIAIVTWLLIWLKKETEKSLHVALGLIIGGAIGNLIDRIRIGAVADFIDVYYNTYHWPAFNAADSFITIGAAIILISSFKCDKKDSDEAIENKPTKDVTTDQESDTEVEQKA